jgi:hypothetical protein
MNIYRNSILQGIECYLPGLKAVEKSLSIAKKFDINYNIKTDFFSYWIGNNLNEKHLLSLKSFFVTQNLSNCTLHLYSTTDVSNHPVIAFFKEKIKTHIFDPIKEIEETPLDRSFLGPILRHELNPALESDFFRLVLLYKYGGVYFDLDILFLRDLAPLLQYEFEYQWGTELDMINGAVMRLKKESPIAREHIEQLKSTPAKYGSLCWANNLYCKVKEKFDDLIIFPSTFFNTEWQCGISSETFFKKCQYSDTMFEGAFTWHWHNKWNLNFEEGSKFDLLKKRTDLLYKEKFGG